MANGRREPVQGQPVPAQATPPSAGRGAPLSSDAQLSALTAVAATLTQQIAVQTGAIAANTAALVAATRDRPGRGSDPGAGNRPPPPRPSTGPDVTGALIGGLRGFALQLVAPLAPLAALAQTLNTTTSGFGTFLKMTSLITTSLAGLFLPAMLVAAGVTFALARAIQGPLMEAMAELAGQQMPALIEIAAGLYDSFAELKDGADALGLSFLDLAGGLTSAAAALKALGVSPRDATQGALGGGVLRLFGDKDVPPELEAWRKGVDPRAPGGEFERAGRSKPKDGAAGFMDDVMKGMDLALRSMKQEIGPPAAFGQDFVSVWRQATLAGLNEDPIAKETRDLMLKQLGVMEQLLAELRDRGALYN